MAVQEDNSDVLEVRLASRSQGVEVLLNQKVLSFNEQNWMDLKGKWRGQVWSAGHPVAFTPSLVLALGCGRLWIK